MKPTVQNTVLDKKIAKDYYSFDGSLISCIWSQALFLPIAILRTEGVPNMTAWQDFTPKTLVLSPYPPPKYKMLALGVLVRGAGMANICDVVYAPGIRKGDF